MGNSRHTNPSQRPEALGGSFRQEGGVRWNQAMFEDPPAAMYDLADMLLDWGGDEVVWATTDLYLLSEMTTRTEIKSGPAETLETGEPSRCHTNAAVNLARPGWGLWTGWALSEDGLWRPHSWNEDEDGRLVETTAQRTAYGGIRLADVEALLFAFMEGEAEAVIAADTQRWLPELRRLYARGAGGSGGADSGWRLLETAH